MTEVTATEVTAAAKKWRTCMGTLSFPHVKDPVVNVDSEGKPKGKPKYSLAILFDGNDPDVRKSLIEGEHAILAAAEEQFGVKAATMIKTGALKQPFRRDWEAKGYPEGTVYLNARSIYRPGTVYAWPDETGKPAKVAEEDITKVFYPGAKVRVTMLAFYYDQEGSKGITFGLNNIQKLADGPRLDGWTAAEDDFEADESLKPADTAALEG